MTQLESTVSLPREITTLFKIKEKEVPLFVAKTVAIELFREGKVSLGKAAEIAGVSKWEMLGLLAERKIPLHYTVDELREDLQAS